MPVDLIVRDGTIVTPEETRSGHVLVADGRILDILFGGDLPPAREVIDT